MCIHYTHYMNTLQQSKCVYIYIYVYTYCHLQVESEQTSEDEQKERKFQKENSFINIPEDCTEP